MWLLHSCLPQNWQMKSWAYPLIRVGRIIVFFIDSYREYNSRKQVGSQTVFMSMSFLEGIFRILCFYRFQNYILVVHANFKQLAAMRFWASSSLNLCIRQGLKCEWKELIKLEREHYISLYDLVQENSFLKKINFLDPILSLALS